MFLSLVLASLSAVSAEALGPGDHTRTLPFGGHDRTYLVHVPPNYKADQPTPVLLIFHGGGTNATTMVRFSHLNSKADKEGFIAVYPNGTGHLGLLTWNGSLCCGYAQQNNVDDVGFTRAMLDELATLVNVDPKRVFATGISNGGILCFRLADELSDRIAAIAPVSGTTNAPTCAPKRPVSVIYFHGTRDEFVVYQGGAGPKSVSRANFISVDHTIEAWVKADGCPEKPVTTQLPDKALDGTTVVRSVYGPGKEESEVVLYQILGGGHTWPGEPAPLKFLGTTTLDISANDLMWEFFEKHPMK